MYPELHKFNIRGTELVFDVNNLNVFEVDNVASAVVDFYGSLSRAQIIKKLRGRFPIDEIVRAYDEISLLQNENITNSTFAVI